MTPEELEALVLNGPTDKLVAALQNLDESERRRLSKGASSLRRKLVRDDPGSQWFPSSRLWQQLARSALAVLAVGPLKEARRIPMFALRDEEETVVEILAGRKPEWADKWLREWLDDENNFFVSWSVIRKLIDLGVCAKPDSAGYVRAMVQHMNIWPRDGSTPKPLSRRLLDEPDLLEDEVWRIFEVDNWALSYDWAQKPGGETWAEALKRLSSEGYLDRSRLLDASLSALWITDKTNSLSGYRRFHEALEPTLEEMSAREDRYRELLSHKTAHIVGFALKRLDALSRKRNVESRAVLERLAHVVTLRQKAHPTAALRLAKRLAEKDETLWHTARDIAIEALVHPSADVQEKAMALLESSRENLDDDSRSRLLAALDDVSPLVRSGLEALLEIERPGDGGDSTLEEEDDLGDAFPPPLERATPADVLRSNTLIEPIENVRTLVDAVAHAIEIVDSPEELERILDGMSRLCDDRPAEFGRWTSPLLARIREQPVSETNRGLLAWGAPAVADLLASWITGEPHRSPLPAYVFPQGPVRFFDVRIRELTERVATRRAAPLLSAPTHTHGWIDPDALVRRVEKLQSLEIPPLRTDLIQALLRLPPGGREKALEAARELSGREGSAIRWALGGTERITEDDRPFATVWLAASRARDPAADWTEVLEPLKLPTNWPDGPTAARCTWDPNRTSVRKNASYDNWTLMMKIIPELPSASRTPRGLKPAERLERLKEALNPSKAVNALSLCPTVLLHERGGPWPIMSMQADWLIAGAAMSWPQKLDGFLSRAVDALMLRLDMNASTLDPNYIYFNALFDPGQPLTEMGVLAIWIAFASKDADVRATAKDLLITAIEDGRTHPEPLAEVLSRLASGGWLKLNRISEALADVARVSPLHELVTAMLLERYLATLPKLPSGSHHVLELLHALRSTLGGKVDPDAARVLQVKGSSKAAKLARAILALDGPDAGVRRARREAWRVRQSLG